MSRRARWKTPWRVNLLGCGCGSGLGDIQYCRMHNDILEVDLFSAGASTCLR